MELKPRPKSTSNTNGLQMDNIHKFIFITKPASQPPFSLLYKTDLPPNLHNTFVNTLQSCSIIANPQLSFQSGVSFGLGQDGNYLVEVIWCLGTKIKPVTSRNRTSIGKQTVTMSPKTLTRQVNGQEGQVMSTISMQETCPVTGISQLPEPLA